MGYSRVPPPGVSPPDPFLILVNGVWKPSLTPEEMAARAAEMEIPECGCKPKGRCACGRYPRCDCVPFPSSLSCDHVRATKPHRVPVPTWAALLERVRPGVPHPDKMGGADEDAYGEPAPPLSGALTVTRAARVAVLALRATAGAGLWHDDDLCEGMDPLIDVQAAKGRRQAGLATRKGGAA